MMSGHSDESQDVPDPATGHPAVEYYLRLYVAGQSPNCVRAVDNLTRLCEEHLPGQYRIELIDLVENPTLARGDEIVAVPTLVRRLPPPPRKIIGDLSQTENVLAGLQLPEAGG